MPMDVALIIPGRSGVSERAVMSQLAGQLGARGNRVLVGDDGNWRSAIDEAELVVVHSPFVFSIAPLLYARMKAKPVAALVWDSYPVTMNGRRYDRRLTRRLADRVEILALRLASAHFVPSRDFLDDPHLAAPRFVPMWAEPEMVQPRGLDPERSLSSPLRILFAGQVNATRGIDVALHRLRDVLPMDFRLTVASGNPLPEELRNDPAVEHAGHMDQAELLEFARAFDFGLVSLSPEFDRAGFPSKTFFYLGAGLPCLYCGPALPHFVSTLESAGCGIDITAPGRLLDAAQLSGLVRDIERSRSDFLAHFLLDPANFERQLADMRGEPS